MKLLLKIFFLVIAIVALVRVGTSFLKSSNTPDGPLPLLDFSIEEQWLNNENKTCEDFKNNIDKYYYDVAVDKVKFCLKIREKCSSIDSFPPNNRWSCIIQVREDLGYKHLNGVKITQ